jgi:hypothetical protein
MDVASISPWQLQLPVLVTISYLATLANRWRQLAKAYPLGYAPSILGKVRL